MFKLRILGKMTADKLTGPKVRISVSKFLPAVFLDAMIESPAISVQMFESTHEHPELIWNEKTRDRVISAISKTSEKLVTYFLQLFTFHSIYIILFHI